MGSSTRQGVWENAYININGIDLSDDFESITVPETVDALPHAAAGDTTAEKTPGLLDWSVTGRAYKDFASAKLHQTLNPLFRGRIEHNIIVAPNGGTPTTTNPVWSGSAFITAYEGPGGTQGQNAMSDITWAAAGAMTVLTS